MSELTKEIAGVTNRIRTQDPGPRGPSFLASLADTASTAIDGVQNIRANRQEARARREAADRERAMDELELANFADREAQFEALNTVRQAPIDIPPDVQRGVEELATIQESVAQGRTTQARARTALESRYRQMMTDHPELASEIAIYMRDQGLDSRVYREIALAEEQADFERETRQQLQREGEQIAVRNIPAERLAQTADGRAAQGFAFESWQNGLERTRAEAAEARAAAAESRTRYNFQRDRAADEAFRASTALLQAELGPLFDQTLAEIASNTLPSGAARLDRLNQLNAEIMSVRSYLQGELAGELGPQAWTQVQQQLDSYQETLQWIISSDDATDILRVLESQAGLSGLEALGPGLTAARAVIGENTLGAILAPEVTGAFLGDGSLEAAALRLVSSGGSTAALTEFSNRSAEYERVLSNRGTPEEIQRVGSTLLTAVDRSSRRILNGDERAVDDFSREYPALLQVTGSEVFQRGMTDPQQAVRASEKLFGRDRITVLRQVNDENLNQASVIAAERALNAMLESGTEGSVPVVGTAGVASRMSFNRETGYFEAAQVSPERQLGLVASGLMPTGNITDIQANESVIAVNRVLDFLTEMGGLQGSPREQRAEWARQPTESDE